MSAAKNITRDELLVKARQYFNEKHPNALISYHDTFSVSNRVKGIVISILFVSFFSIYGLAFSGNLNQQTLSHLFHNINYTKFAVGAAVAVILTIGGSVVIHRALKRKDPLMNAGPGRFSGSDHIQDAIQAKKRKEISYERVYVDTSTLADGNGKMYVYSSKGLVEHYGITTFIAFTTPVYFVGVEIFNVLRLIFSPLFILGCCILESFKKEGFFEKTVDGVKRGRKFKPMDAYKSAKNALFHIIAAPFFATAFFFASIYALIDPFNGRKLVKRVEEDWNDGLPRAKSFWSVRGFQKLWPGMKTFAADEDKLTYSYAGCMGAMAIETMKDNQITEEAKSLSEAIKEGSGTLFHILLFSEILQGSE